MKVNYPTIEQTKNCSDIKGWAKQYLKRVKGGNT